MIGDSARVDAASASLTVAPRELTVMVEDDALLSVQPVLYRGSLILDSDSPDAADLNQLIAVLLQASSFLSIENAVIQVFPMNAGVEGFWPSRKHLFLCLE